MKSKEILHNIFQNIEVRIGEVNEVVGVSQRQLRYWEKKGYIEPISDDNSGVRRYNLSTLYLIVFIKEQLDNGFILAAAFGRSKDIELKSKVVRTFSEYTFSDVEITDAEKGYGEIDLDDFRTEGGEKYHFKGVFDAHGGYVKIDK